MFECFVAEDDSEQALAVAREALDVVAALDRQLSHYRDDSDISRLNAMADAEWVRVEPELFALLKHCSAWCDATGGAFDVAVGALLDAWDFHRGSGAVASEAEIEAALAVSGMGRVLLDAETSRVHYATSGLALNLGAVGKGYALDKAAEVLSFYGSQRAVIHGGQSTILAVGAPPDEAAWQFVIRDPRDRATAIETIRVRDAALSTSGSYDQYVEANGVRYGHILDPRTGRPVQEMLSVSVVAPTAAEADALSTAFFVMGRERTLDFCIHHPGLSVVMLSEPQAAGDRPNTRALGSQPSALSLPALSVTRIGLP